MKAAIGDQRSAVRIALGTAHATPALGTGALLVAVKPAGVPQPLRNIQAAPSGHPNSANANLKSSAPLGFISMVAGGSIALRYPPVWGARTCPRSESGDMSPHPKRNGRTSRWLVPKTKGQPRDVCRGAPSPPQSFVGSGVEASGRWATAPHHGPIAVRQSALEINFDRALQPLYHICRRMPSRASEARAAARFGLNASAS